MADANKMILAKMADENSRWVMNILSLNLDAKANR